MNETEENNSETRLFNINERELLSRLRDYVLVFFR